MAIFGHFSGKSPGSYRGKTPEFGQFWPKSWKTAKNPGFPGSGGRPEGGFTSTPRAGAPRFPAGAGGYLSRGGVVQGLPGSPGEASRGPQVPETPGGYRGAPPRGVDVKPPPRRCPGPGNRVPGLPRTRGPPGGPRGPHPGSRGPGPRPLSGVRRVSGRPRRALPGLREPPPGVDVKPLRRGGPEGRKSPKIPQNGVLWPKRPFLGIFAENGHFWPLFRKKPR